jgi:ATP-dependent DNA helicase RecG
LSRNPQLHYVFAQMDLAEERGLGMKTLGLRPRELGLPMPKYSFEDPYLVLTLYQSSDRIVDELDLAVRTTLNSDEIKALKFIAINDSITSKMLKENMGLDERKAQRILSKLVNKSLISRAGKGPATKYRMIRP